MAAADSGSEHAMTEEPARTHRESIVVAATPEALYDVVSDITRTGEWSPICTACWWDDQSEAGQVGARFTGHNEQPGRTWETRSRVVAADRPREFAWVVGDDYVRWGYTLEPDAAGTTLTESWQFLPNGIAMFHDKYGDEATAHIEERTDQAHRGIPQTLAAVKRIAESA
ncbi:SRPBCC family protein [Flexivirga lutea]